MEKKKYITPLCRAVHIGGEDGIAQIGLDLGVGSKYEDGMDILTKEEVFFDDDYSDASTGSHSSSNIWDQAW